MLFRDREDAGRQLAERLQFLKGQSNLIVLGIPRGGVIVAAEVASALSAPLQVFIAHKVGAPSNPEYAIGAITSTGQVILDREAIIWLGLPKDQVDREIKAQHAEVSRRLELYTSSRKTEPLEDKTIVLVDDGVATGMTTMVALRALREMKPSRLYLAVPVGPPDVIDALAKECDGAISCSTPEPFMAVGRFYTHFGQTTDEQVVQLLEEAHSRMEKGEVKASA